MLVFLKPADFLLQAAEEIKNKTVVIVDDKKTMAIIKNREIFPITKEEVASEPGQILCIVGTCLGSLFEEITEIADMLKNRAEIVAVSCGCPHTKTGLEKLVEEGFFKIKCVVELNCNQTAAGMKELKASILKLLKIQENITQI